MSAVMQQQEFGAPEFLRALPERPELIECVTNERPLHHTGKIAGKDSALCRAVCMDLLVGRPKAHICADYQVGWETVTAIEARMRATGELREIGKVIVDLLSQNIVLMGLKLREALLNGELSPSQIPIPMAALIDKKAQLDAGLIPGTDLSVEQVDVARQRALFERTFGSPDGHSGGKRGNGPIIDVSQPATTQDATGPAPSRPSGSAGPDQAPAAAAGTPEPGPAGGGGDPGQRPPAHANAMGERISGG